jgi:hypothetical protein
MTQAQGATGSNRFTRAQLERLVAFAGQLHENAEACAQHQLWQAAAILVAESVEAALLGTVVCSEPELRAANAWPSRGDPPQRWPLQMLLDVARRAGWLPKTMSDNVDPAEALSGEIGDAVEFLCEVRNLAAHPGRVIASERLPGFDFADDDQMSQVYRVLDGIAAEVFSKLAGAIQALP